MEVNNVIDQLPFRSIIELVHISPYLIYKPDEYALFSLMYYVYRFPIDH